MNLTQHAAPRSAATVVDLDPVASASALIPALRTRSAETDALAKLPDETITDIEGARLFDLVVPKIYGGLQASLDTWMDTVVQLGKGDGSTAWTVGLRAASTWMFLTAFPKHVVDDVFAISRKLPVASVLVPRRVKTRRVDGGVVIEDGLWGFNSGVLHAQWDLLGIPILSDDGQIVDRGVALVPTSQVTPMNDWNTIGLRGSGSISVTAKDVFVPSERIASLSKILREDYACTHLRDAPLYRIPLIPLLATNLVFPALGMAKAALALFVEGIGKRGIAYTTYDRQDEAAVTHLQLGEASSKIDAAESVIRRSVAALEANGVREDARMTLDERTRIWRDAGFASQLIWEAVNMLACASGGSLANVGNPMTRLWLDVRVAGLHGAVCTSTTMELFGRLLAGKKPNSPLLV